MLKRLAVSLVLSITIFSAMSSWVAADVFVPGYLKGNGTYVQPHYRSDPDGIRSNNWSYRGNRNPYTGKIGRRSY